MKHQVPQLDKIIFYYAYIYSKIQYGIEVYGRACSLHKDIDILLVQDIFKLYINNSYITNKERHKITTQDKWENFM